MVVSPRIAVYLYLIGKIILASLLSIYVPLYLLPKEVINKTK